ncbi:MAG: iron(III) transport system substrate-binding protein, partial [Polaribacter sp.]
MKKIVSIVLLSVLVFACKSEKKQADNKEQEVNVYTHRHYASDQELFSQFEKQTGIKVNVV